VDNLQLLTHVLVVENQTNKVATMSELIEIKKCNVSFTRLSEKSFSVEIAAHNSREINSDKEVWNWNVYAYIREEHPFFTLSESSLSDELHFHGGITYAQYFINEPMGGIKYDWQKVNRYYKVGSDYCHYQDDYDNHDSPFDGIPTYVQYDADLLIGQLQSAVRRLTVEEQP